MVPRQSEGTDGGEKKVLLKGVGSGPGGYPRIGQLVAKAAAIRSLMYWVEAECKIDLKYASRTTGRPVAGTPATTDNQFRLKSLQYNCIHGFSEADRICRRAGRLFTAEEHAEFCGWLELGLVSCNALAAEALMANKKLFKLVPKFHAMTHYYDTRLNPRRVSCYQDEDMVGRMKKITSTATEGRLRNDRYSDTAS